MESADKCQQEWVIKREIRKQTVRQKGGSVASVRCKIYLKTMERVGIQGQLPTVWYLEATPTGIFLWTREKENNLDFDIKSLPLCWNSQDCSLF